MQTFLLYIIFFVMAKICYCAKILAYVPSPSYSHEIPFKPLWKELSLRGHQVLVITPNPVNDKSLINLTEIDVSFSRKLEEDFVWQLINTNISISNYIRLCRNIVRTVSDSQLSFSKVREIIDNPKEHFDVVLVESRYSAMYGFGKRFHCPIIAVSANEPFNAVYKQLGNPTHPILYPELRTQISANPTLLERVMAVIIDTFTGILTDLVILPVMQEVLNKHFGEEYNLRELEESVSLLLVNSNSILNGNRPLTPIIIKIGGHSIRNPGKPLEIELKTILDNSKDGFVYFSLGSAIDHKSIPENTLQTILKTFEELPYTILWKFNVNLEKVPKNVILLPWVPQQEILNHPNLKLFITQGGRMSVEEAVYAEVPIVGMPIFADQPRNIQNLVTKRAALSVKYKTLDKDDFKNVILEVIGNPQYKERVRELAKLSKDQPMTGIERAVWWTEYVIRHNGTKHLRSPLLDIPWYQYYLLDVFAVILLTIIFTAYVLVLLIRIVVKTFKYVISNKIKLA